MNQLSFVSNTFKAYIFKSVTPEGSCIASLTKIESASKTVLVAFITGAHRFGEKHTSGGMNKQWKLDYRTDEIRDALS